MKEKQVKWKYEIGQVIKDEKRNLTIIDRKIIKSNKIDSHNKKEYLSNEKWYLYHCNKCNCNLWTKEYNIYYNKKGCSCCSNTVIVKGINDIATTNPEMIKYFANIEDAYTHTYGSNDKILCKCPNCGFEKEVTINVLLTYGFSCPICSDGLSYPEKTVGNILNKLNVNFKTQLSKATFKWVGKYKYDFYFELNNEEYIIETHGKQHYENGFVDCGGRTLEEEQQNDKIKKELAIHNGIKEENYIIIDCSISNINFIKNNILKSKLNKIFDLSSIDWIEIDINSKKSLVKEVCNYWYLHNEINNECLTTTDIGNVFKLGSNAILTYLKAGTKLGWCNYSYNVGKKYANIKSGKLKKIKIKVIKEGNVIGIYESAKYIEDNSINLFGVKLSRSKISNVCNGKRKSHKGYTFKYIK